MSKATHKDGIPYIVTGIQRWVVSDSAPSTRIPTVYCFRFWTIIHKLSFLAQTWPQRKSLIRFLTASSLTCIYNGQYTFFLFLCWRASLGTLDIIENWKLYAFKWEKNVDQTTWLFSRRVRLKNRRIFHVLFVRFIVTTIHNISKDSML